MIKVIENKDNIIIEGHAGYAPIGKDIVCAGVSALTFTLSASLKKLTTCDETIRDGYYMITTKDLPRDARLLVEAFFIGISAIQKRYPAHINVTRRGSR